MFHMAQGFMDFGFKIHFLSLSKLRSEELICVCVLKLKAV